MFAGRRQTSRACALLLAMLASALLACTMLVPVTPAGVATQTPVVQQVFVTATPGPSPTAGQTATAVPPTAVPTPDLSAAREGIEETVSLFAQAYNDNDVTLLRQAVDQANAPFRRMMQMQFDDYQESFYSGAGTFRFDVESVRALPDGYVLGHIRVPGGWVADWVFREAGGRWVLTEPAVAEVGDAVTTEHESFVFTTYPWADDVNADIIQLVENARARVEAKLGKVPDEQAAVTIRPIYGLEPFDPPSALAYYQRGVRGELDKIKIYTPNSYNFGFYDPDLGWEQALEDTLTHEYTHMTHVRSFDNAGHLATWMVEGLAEYVSDADTRDIVSLAVAADEIIPIIDEVTPVYKQDLMHMESLNQDVGLAYGLAHSLVIYVTEEYGGLDGFWDLARAYDTMQNLDKALQQAFDVTYEQFDQDWRGWLRETY
jgi:hypothetical protein